MNTKQGGRASQWLAGREVRVRVEWGEEFGAVYLDTLVIGRAYFTLFQTPGGVRMVPTRSIHCIDVEAEWPSSGADEAPAQESTGRGGRPFAYDRDLIQRGIGTLTGSAEKALPVSDLCRKLDVMRVSCGTPKVLWKILQEMAEAGLVNRTEDARYWATRIVEVEA